MNAANPLGTERIGKLLFQQSLPATVAMGANALYNLVDTIFVGRFVGTEAIGGLALAVPMQAIVMGLAMMIGTGAASIISRALGAGDRDRACRAAGNVFSSALLAGVTIGALGLVFVDPLLLLLGSTPSLEGHAREYLSVILFGSPAIVVAMSANNIARAEGRAKIAMATMLTGTITNLVLDPIFILGLDMGVRGVALATVISQCLSFLFMTGYFAGGFSSLGLRARHLRPDPAILRETFALGFPGLLRHGGGSLVMILTNNLFARFDAALFISAYGVVGRLLLFSFMPVFGVVQGTQPIVGFNYGAGHFARVRRALGLAIGTTTGYFVAVFLALFFLPELFIGIFTRDPALIDAGRTLLRFNVLALPLLGFQVIGASYFQSVGKLGPSLLLNMSRQFLFLLPLLLTLPGLLGLQGVFVSFPAADFLAIFLTIAWLAREVGRLGAPAAAARPTRA